MEHDIVFPVRRQSAACHGDEALVMTRVAERVAELRSMYDAPKACAADLLCDRHPGDRVAFRVVDVDLTFRDVTFAELADRSRRVAAALAELGVQPGDRVATVMGKSLDLVVALLGIWRRGAVHVPLFTAFAESTVAARLAASRAKAVVCDAAHRHKVGSGKDQGPAGVQVIIAGTQHGHVQPGDVTMGEWMTAYQPDAGAAASVAVGGHGVLVQLYTSGTTGTPKAVPLPVKGLAALHTYLEYGLDISDDDVYWNAADPGWGYGLFYGIIGPLAAARRNLLLASTFDPELTWEVMARFGVTNFAAAPTVFRALRGCCPPNAHELPLRRLSSAGEPLTADVISWATETLGVPVRDHYGQSEHGMVVVNGWHGDIKRPLKNGSMGCDMPGWRTRVLLTDKDEIAPPLTVGRIAIDVPASALLWFPGYFDASVQTAERYSPDRRWYYTGDTGWRDEDGYLFFTARDDDVIIMAGYRIGPFEVESALVSHPHVAEAAVVGVPDALRGEVIEAFIVLSEGVAPSPALATQLQQHVKQHYAAHAYPRSIHFVPALPKNPSGKLQRSVLRQQRNHGVNGSPYSNPGSEAAVA
ncbi:AMP-binding protein [Plantactinospora sp. GCM10030261]|uniref:AMP-binding protein n=1 Tax=Plantactinospora sp. GCM10030261 TaxID=3273420 RepID=UPI0036181DB9